jgi:oxaloacetate decarboxylase alpha subunit
MNVMNQQRYKVIPKEIKDYVRGLYGKSPIPVDEKMRKKIIGDEETIDYRPADDLSPLFEEYKEKYKDLVRSDEDVLSCALFPKIATDYLKKQKETPLQIEDEIIEIELFTD